MKILHSATLKDHPMPCPQSLIWVLTAPFLIAILLASPIPALIHAADTPPSAAIPVRDAVTQWSGYRDALRASNLVELFSRLPASEQKVIRTLWGMKRTRGSLADIAERHSFLYLIHAVETLSKPGTVGQFDPGTITRLSASALDHGDADSGNLVQMTTMVNGVKIELPISSGGPASAPSWLSTLVRRILATGHETVQAVELAEWLQNAADWLPQAGFADKVLRQKSTAIARENLVAMGIDDMRSISALPLDQALVQYGTSLAALKRMLLLYRIDIDSLLDTLVFTVIEGPVGQTTMEARLRVGSRTCTMPLAIVLADGGWCIIGNSLLARLLPASTGGGMSGIPGLTGLGGAGHNLNLDDMIRKAKKLAEGHRDQQQKELDEKTLKGTNAF